MTRLEEIKKRCEQAKLDVVIYPGKLDEISVSSEAGEIKVFNPGPNPIFEDMQWLISQVEKAIALANVAASLPEPYWSAREFLETMK